MFHNGLAFLCSGGDFHVWEPLEEVPSREAQEHVGFDGEDKLATVTRDAEVGGALREGRGMMRSSYTDTHRYIHAHTHAHRHTHSGRAHCLP